MKLKCILTKYILPYSVEINKESGRIIINILNNNLTITLTLQKYYVIIDKS